VREAIETVVPLRRCNTRIARRGEITAGPACGPAQLGVATCPCRGHVDDSAYAALVDVVQRGVTTEPALLLDPLAERMRKLARAERYEEAAATRDRFDALRRALQRDRAVASVRSAARVVVDSDEGRVELRHGRVVFEGDGLLDRVPPPDLTRPPARDEIDELLTVARWLSRAAASLTVVDVDGPLVSILPRVGDSG
jgi:DNA polymerase-3 subunit epsilon